MSLIPEDRKYTDHDEWVKWDGDVLRIGITDHAQNELGELVHVELPEVGDSFDTGDEVCEVESVKAVAQIYAPVAGEVVEVNEALEDEAEKLNEDPYGTWIFAIRPSDTDALNSLLDAKLYAERLA